ncbi:RICIN domain-containing protein [Micromonospora sp. RB23]
MKKRAKLRRVWHRLLATRRGRAEMGAFGLSVSAKDQLWKSVPSPRPGYATTEWKRVDVGGGAVWITNGNSGKVLEVDDAVRVRAQQDQRWRLLGS